MTELTALSATLSAELVAELERFEQQFTYPLGPERWFRISHGADYSRFFRAMGEATSLVACRGGRVVGTLGVAVRDLVLPDGERRSAAYFGDLKIAPSARGGRVLPDLANGAREWVGDKVVAAFAVVMGGTPVTPERYTGRLGIPIFREVGRVSVLRFDTSVGARIAPEWVVPVDIARARLRTLARGRYHTDDGTSAVRSEIDPVGLVAPNGSAGGWVEDTARAKRLIANDGTELRSAHLSGFGYASPGSGAALLRTALGIAFERTFPALFVAVPLEETDSILQLLPDVPVTVAPAIVYGAGLQPSVWNVNTAEI
ncbi:N-acetyltransferase [Fimbriiglobus ruber]|uniref:N-acetyltransferase domain-containing protein n=1 Tax=Fimbriiglobus ruber TaxID=1908690 RepID=A0A225D7I5_9BACT|nr:N-acetyltransferase [Fimbriiglobus ruber]OWK34508.1 hypothetical protein FRUB_10479 [Fimbriiglobus ruber]